MPSSTQDSFNLGMGTEANRMCIGLLLLQLEDDFFDEKRILLRVDRSAKKGVDFLASRRRYMRRNMWAMAVIHLRRATSWLG